jgi:hypothetical protein
MKPLVIFALWAYAGWVVGASAEAFAGIPAVIGILGGVVIGTALALEVRRRIGAAASGSRATASKSSLESAPVLDRAA